MRKLFLMGLVGLMGQVVVKASPQTSDRDLKAIQAPPILVNGSMASGISPNGLQVKVSGAMYNSLSDFSAASGVDLSAVTTLISSIVLTSDADVAKYPLSSLTTIQGGNETSSSGATSEGGSDTIYFGGENAFVTASGLTEDPGFGITTLAGGTASYVGAGNAVLTVSGSFTSLVSHVGSISVGGYSQSANAGTGQIIFSNCPNLETLDLSALTSINVGNSFSPTILDVSGCPSLTSVLMSAFCEVNFDFTYADAPGGYITFQGDALSQAALQVILESLCNGGLNTASTNGFPMTLDLSGGTNASPSVQPELDDIAIGTPGNGDSFNVSCGGDTLSPFLVVSFDNTIAFSASSYGSSHLTIGIQDSPSNDSVAALIASTISGLSLSGVSATASGSTVHLALAESARWGGGCTNISGSTSTFTNTQNGVDYISLLAACGWSVSTN